MSNNIETQPLENFTIYRDGELDKAYYFEQQAKRFFKGLGHVAYISLEATVNVLDEIVQSAQ